MWTPSSRAAVARRGRGLTRDEFVHSHPVRIQLVMEIRRRPGLGLKGLAGLVGQGPSSLKWHLQVLGRHGLIQMHEGPTGRYYTTPEVLPDMLQTIDLQAVLKRRGRLQVLQALAGSGTLAPTEGFRALGISAAVARQALVTFTELGLATVADEQETRYAITSLGRRMAGMEPSSTRQPIKTTID